MQRYEKMVRIKRVGPATEHPVTGDSCGNLALPEQFKTAGIQPEEDEQEHCKCPERGPPVTEKRQRNPDHRQETDGHANIDQNVDKKD